MPEGEKREPGASRAEEEMAVLGRLVLSTRVFLEHAASAYVFFAYGLAVPGFVIVLAGLAADLGVAGEAAASWAGSLLGAVVATLLIWKIGAGVFEVLGPGAASRARRGFLAGLALFIVVSAALVLALLKFMPEAAGVAWYYGLNLTLALLSPLMGGWAFLAAAATMAAFLPLVLYTLDVAVATGAVMIAYLAGGSYSLWKASRASLSTTETLRKHLKSSDTPPPT